jgi:hypothetical protein
MNIKEGTWLIIFLLVTVFPGRIRAESGDTVPSIDPKAESIIRQLSERSKNRKHYTFSVIDTIDEVQENGQKLQFSHARTVTVSRPDRLKVVTTGDFANRSIWKNEKIFTILDRDENVYGRVKSPGTIEETMDFLLERYGALTPLADLLSEDIYSVLTDRAREIRYIGLHHAAGIKCHHLAGTQEDLDWQIWIDSGDQPRFRKLVITYKRLPGQPHYSAVLREFKVIPAAGGDAFKFEPPPGAEQIKFMPVFNKPESAPATSKGGD